MWSGHMQVKSLQIQQLNHTVSRQRSRGMEMWERACKTIYMIIHVSKLTHYRPSLNAHVPRLVGPLEELPNKPCRVFFLLFVFLAAWVELIGRSATCRACRETGRKGDKTREGEACLTSTPFHIIISNPSRSVNPPNQTTSRRWRSEMNPRPIYNTLSSTKANVCGKQLWGDT